jgi:hypothetical protein
LLNNTDATLHIPGCKLYTIFVDKRKLSTLDNTKLIQKAEQIMQKTRKNIVSINYIITDDSSNVSKELMQTGELQGDP